MDNIAFEDRLITLAKRGFRASVDVSVPDYGQHKGTVQFSARLKKGDYGSTCGMEATGIGGSLDEAIGSALRAGEAFLGNPEHPEAVDRALGDLLPALPSA